MTTEDNIKVLCRFRPLKNEETETKHIKYTNTNILYDDISFNFDKIFNTSSSQQDIYDFSGKILLENFISGYNGTILAYGQSGCLDPETPILCYNGKIKSAKDITCNDVLIGDDFEPRKVLELFTGYSNMYLVEQIGGTNYIVNKDHILTIISNGIIIDIPVRFLIDGGIHYGLIANKKEHIVTKIKVTFLKFGKFCGWRLNKNHRFQLWDGTITHNSGKTHTMMGNEKLPGIIPNFINDLFMKVSNCNGIESIIRFSFVEIYMEQVKDLLNISNDNLKVRESKSKGIWIENVTVIPINSLSNAFDVIKKGEINRTIASTSLNKESSRSHSILMVDLIRNYINESKTTTSKMVFVDLAGSEKNKQSETSGLTLLQAKHINKSLSTLGLVIKSLVESSTHIPYRDSKLTRILTESLGGNSKTFLIINCVCSNESLDETLSTLRFGKSAKYISNKTRINIDLNLNGYRTLLLDFEKKIKDQQNIIDVLTNNDQKSNIVMIDKINKLETTILEQQNKIDELQDLLSIENEKKENIRELESRILEFSKINNELNNKIKTYESILENLEKNRHIISSKSFHVKILEKSIKDINENNRVNIQSYERKILEMEKTIKELIKDSINNEIESKRNSIINRL